MGSSGFLTFTPKFHPNFNTSTKPTSHGAKGMAAATPSATARSFGFQNLMETFTVDVQRAEGRPLNVPLIAPFTIASSRLERVENVAIRIELSNGCVGWGEAPVLPFVTAEDQPTALAKTAEACEFLKRSEGRTLGVVLGEIGGILPGHEFASVRAGVEMALIDAVANSIDVPIWRLFGGVSDTITTDITIPIVSSAEAAELASKYRKQGFKTLKLKVGKNLTADIEVLQSIRMAHPDCLFILDANEGYSSAEAIQVLEKLHASLSSSSSPPTLPFFPLPYFQAEMGVTPVLFEQPVHRDDWEGLGHVTHVAKHNYGVSVAADESCRCLEDVKKIVKGDLADVINIKLCKVGVIGALEIIRAARASGLNLMIGGMVETRLAMGFAGHLAAGLGFFNTLLSIAVKSSLFCKLSTIDTFFVKFRVPLTGSQMLEAMVVSFIGKILPVRLAVVAPNNARTSIVSLGNMEEN
ncbi:hypothetical protein RJ640_001508 [Escallonia rubra]|uniref:Dipeptide epimerase n=1 Tax=Escallonia rubra TaxID=112253 RepID=A0AA88UKI6_9ASTE|nr:hypothetical protein RJ640_001508 [Escallonia rubra]